MDYSKRPPSRVRNPSDLHKGRAMRAKHGWAVRRRGREPVPMTMLSMANSCSNGPKIFRPGHIAIVLSMPQCKTFESFEEIVMAVPLRPLFRSPYQEAERACYFAAATRASNSGTLSSRYSGCHCTRCPPSSFRAMRAIPPCSLVPCPRPRRRTAPGPARCPARCRRAGARRRREASADAPRR